MASLFEFDLEDGSSDVVYIEVDEKLPTPKPKPVDDRISHGGVTQKATQSFGKALSVIKPVANAIVDKVKSLNEPADEVGGWQRFVNFTVISPSKLLIAIVLGCSI